MNQKSNIPLHMQQALPLKPSNEGGAVVTNGLIELGRPRFEPGYWRGMRQPAVLVPLQLTRLEVAAAALHRFDNILADVSIHSASAPLGRFIDAAISKHPLFGRVLKLTLGSLEQMGMPVIGGATTMKTHPQSVRHWIVGLPAIAEGIRAPQAVFALACGLVNDLAVGKQIRPDVVAAELKKLAVQFRPLAPVGVNTLRFLEAAHEMRIPWRHVANNVYQFGWGRQSRWLDSSFTDQTSVIGASLARDKVACAKVLRDAGLPVPKHQLVSSAEQAVKVAEVMGYPVVVKPANLDGGAGVLAGLRDPEAVSSAFAATAKLSKRVLVEQFVDGNDYRIRICKNEVIGVVIRKPAAVVGDGVKPVRALIDSVNTERAKLTMPLDLEVEQGSKPIVVDDEVQQWLAAQGFNLDSVVSFGQRVRLRGAANVSLGGTTWDVTHETHPDNMALALNAAAALRLDVAGVDLLLPDIARSWRDTGGAVCEVNGQPQFSSGSAHRQVLERLVRHQGRIPVVGVMQDCVDTTTLEHVVQKLKHDGVHVYVASTVLQCQRALQGADADAVIWQIDGLPSRASGVPIDHMDVLIQPRALSTLKVPVPFSVGDCWELSETPDLKQVTQRLLAHVHKACAQH